MIKHTPIIYIVVTVIHIYCVCICLILVTFRYRGTGLNPAVSHNSVASPVLGYINKGQNSSWVTQRNSIFGVSRHIDIMVKLWPSVTPNVYQGVSKLKKKSHLVALMIHAKRNSHAKFQQIWCAFGRPASHIFRLRPRLGSKNAIFSIHKKSNNSTVIFWGMKWWAN